MSAPSVTPATSVTSVTLPDFFSLHAYDSLESTNVEALRLAGENAPEGTLVWTKTQTKGKGRMGRAWVSDPGNLFFSVVFRPDTTLQEAAQLSFVAAVAVGEALDRQGARNVQTKWPNDVLLGERKVAGILLESRTKPSPAGDGLLDAVVTGIGINVTSHPHDVRFPATHLHADPGLKNVDDARLLEELAPVLAAWYARWRSEGFSPVRDAWLGRAAHLGEEITVRLSAGGQTGVFSGLDGEGALILQTEGGERIIRAGDVYF